MICQRKTYEDLLAAARSFEDFKSLLEVQILAQVLGEIEGFERAERVNGILRSAEKVLKDERSVERLVTFFQEKFREMIPGSVSFYKDRG